MALRTLWTIAYRDVRRNRRRSLLTATAVALGLALLIVFNSLIAGVLEDSMQNAIRLDSGHVQVRAADYEQDKLSLRRSDLVDGTTELVSRVTAMEAVESASPVLWLGTILATRDESVDLRVSGIDPASAVHAPFRDAVVEGAYLAPDDRGGVLVGKRLADSLGLGVGQNVNLAIVNADGEVDEGPFEIRGLFATGVPVYDESTVLMPLAKAQAFAGTGDRASAVVILLGDDADAESVAAAMEAPGYEILTWRDLNEMLLQAVQMGMSFYVILDLIVMLVVAVVIANTLLMTVFERVREMGVFAALGMKRRQILQMFMLEATILGLVGIAGGVILGLLGVAYLATAGLFVGDEMAMAGGSVAMGTTMYARFVPGLVLGLSAATLLVILLVSLYPARFASRLEPVEALHQT